jgi:bifunctional DNA-binding transcriptional regulator/antitoxin component of YhaV-PrlF toxin-antitoxin module
VGRWVKLTFVELDDKGRALLPVSVRKKVRTRRFEIKVVKGKIELIPVEDIRALKGKYANRLKSPWIELEEKAEKFVKDTKR